MTSTRDAWIDNIKVFACALVAIGHLLQSMVNGGVFPGNDGYQWFNKTIYYFHVPLFFICSGFLYQKGSAVNAFASWKTNVQKKLLTLGVPYFTFSLITWLLKTVFASSVNNEVSGLVDSMFLHPMSPYWYLYTLFFVFLITPTFLGRKTALIGLGIALIFKLIKICGVETGIYAVSSVMEYGIWFVLGMNACVFDLSAEIRKRKWFISVGAVLAGLFLGFSILIHYLDLQFPGTQFLMGLLACVSVLLIAVCAANYKGNIHLLAFLSQYTMPIFLMHTIFAAGLRSVLFKIDIESASIHIIFGMLISFIGPIIAAEIMKRVGWMEFFLYPGKFMKVGQTKGRQRNV